MRIWVSSVQYTSIIKPPEFPVAKFISEVILAVADTQKAATIWNIENNIGINYVKQRVFRVTEVIFGIISVMTPT